MPFVKAFIPTVKGLDQSIDERIRPPDSLHQVTNGYFDKTGAIRKRHGFTQIGTLDGDGNGIDDQGNALTGVRVIFSTGPELCAIDQRHLYGFSDNWLRWVNKGPVSPFIGTQTPILGGEVTYDQADMSYHGGYYLHVARRKWAFDAPITVSTQIRAEVATTVVDSGGNVISELPYTGILSATADASKVHSVRAGSCNGKLLMFTAVSITGACTLTCYEWDTATPSSAAPTFAHNITTDLWFAGQNVRSYDVHHMASGDYVVAYIDDTDQNINLERFNSSHVSQDRSTIVADDEGTFRRIAITEDTDTPSLAVMCVYNGGSADVVRVYTRNVSTLVAVDGPANLRTTTDVAENLGIGFGEVSSEGEPSFQCTWGESPVSWNETALWHSRINYDLSRWSNPGTRYNLMPMSQPFFQDERQYVACNTTVSSHSRAAAHKSTHSVSSFAIDCAAVIELESTLGEGGGGGSISSDQLAGLHDIGTAPFGAGGQGLRWGNGTKIAAGLGDAWRYMYVSTSYNLLADANNIAVRYSASEVDLDFDSSPGVAIMTNGSAIIGGGYVTWYSGAVAHELGHAVMPVPYTNTPSNTASGGLTASTDYTYQAVWESHDQSGVLHRSLPSYQVTYNTGVGNDTIDIVCKSNPATARLTRVHDGVVWHRIEGDIPKRLTEASRYTPNNNNFGTDSFDDIDQSLGAFLYTVGGEIENVCPEGARLPVIAGGRLWLGDFFRRDRVQYSKPFAPGTAAETAIAPEFNEGFGFLLENSQSVSAMGAVDDKLVVFTTDAVFTVTGQGPADDGSQNDFSGLILVSSDAGCVESRSVVTYPDGLLFLSKGGIYALTRGLQIQNIGKAIEDDLADFPTITSGVLVPDENQVRFTCMSLELDSGIVLVYDYRIKQWAKWTLGTGGEAIRPTSACMHNGEYYVADTGGAVFKYDRSTWLDGPEYVSLTVETGWIQGAEQSGWQRVRKAVPLLGYESDCDITVSVFHEFDDSTASQSHTWISGDLQESGSDRMLPQLHVKRQKCTAFKVRIVDTERSGGTLGTGGGYNMAGIQLELMPKRGVHRGVNDTQRN